MFTILVILVLGVVAGWVFRHHDCTKKVEISTSATVALLILTFGLSISSHKGISSAASTPPPDWLVQLAYGEALSDKCIDALLAKRDD